MCAAMVDRNTEYPDYGRPMYDSQPQNDYGRTSYDYNRPTYDSYQQPGDYNRSSYEAPRGQDYPPYQNSSDPPVKDEQANRRREEIVHQQQASPPQPTNQTEMYDHNQMSQQLREERRKEYNDYLENHKQSDVKSVKSDRSPSSPSKQQKEQILNRAQHQLEIPVIDRRQANPDPPPPLHPPQDRPPSGRWDPESYRQSSFGQVKRVTSPPHQANIGHDDYGAFRRQTELEVRRKDYNEFLVKKQQQEDDKKQRLAEQRRQAPAPIVKGDYYDSEQYDLRRQALNDLQHKEYQNYLKNKGFNQHQPPETNRRPEIGMKSEFQDQEPAGRQSQRNAPLGSLIAGERVDYPSSANERFNKERRKEYNDYIKPQDLQNIHRKREEAIAKIESDGIDLDKVRIFPQGEYEQKHKELQQEWRKNFRDFAAKKYEVVKKDLQERERVLASYYRKDIDNPTILPAGEYKERQKDLQKQWRDECRDYYSGHPVVQRSKDIWKEDEPVHTIPQSGEYKGRRQRLNAQLQKEFQQYQSQKIPPKERIKEFGLQGAVLFDPGYNKEVKNRMREERSKDLKEFLEKQDADRYKRQDNVQSNNRIGFMSQLGRPVEEMREKLAKERHEEYNKYLQDKYVSQSQHRPLERPKWVDPKLMEDNWQKEAAGSRSRPSSDKPVKTPTYEEMLERKRREEASYRRFDDPEYSRSGADRGYDSQYRRYNDPQ